ncbi:AzlD domain-containing protein [Haloarchaeobius sp. DFWS5]|uniref:AzlD domain-containing protein n=1 Tax=Haloarchaeobius sp. DFWS5 TaxID=3446114 RepID=UPI003EB801A1
MTTYSDQAVWLVILLAGLGTYAIRLSFILLLGRLDAVPPRLETVLRFVPAAVLAALVVPSVVAMDPSFGLDYELTKVVAAVAAGIVAWRTENVLATIGVGMVTLWVVGAAF